MGSSGVEFREIWELKCLTELEEVSPVAMAIGYIAIPLCLLTPLPQYWKIFRRNSAVGLSSMMLLVGNLGRAFNMINLFILHYDQIQLCFSGPGMMKTCQPSLLVLYSGISGFIALLPLYFVVMHMNKSTGSTNSTPTNTIGGTTDRKGDQNQRALWFGVFAQLAIIAIAAAPIPYLIKVGRCGPLQDYANIIGFFNTFFLCVQYLPQIFLTLAHRDGGAVSYLTYLPDVVGGYVMTAEKIFGTHERISTWFPYLLMHTLELIMVSLSAMYDETIVGWIGSALRWRKYRVWSTERSDPEDALIMKRDHAEHNCKGDYLYLSVVDNQ